MLTLNDGRSELWQWDTNRKLTVDADCSQVHFSNKVFGRSIDVDVVDGVAEIPDILLQTDKDLSVWAFVGTAENGYTKISKVFKVNRRNKPADYVFTPSEQTTLAEIMKRIDDLEAIQDPDAIKNAVDDYLANNPIKVEEKDPTVPEWAKEPTPPDVKIPDKLPNPNSITFTGAVNASYDGSSPVEIKIPDSGGNVDLTGVVKSVNGVTPDENGNVDITVSGTATAIDYDQNVHSVNHRGYSASAPENTIPAYILSKQMGFTYAEADVSFTSDGVAVLLHDATIDRTSNGSGSISAMTYAEASKYDYGSWKNTKYTGTRIPTFEEFIILCKRIGLHPYIELKQNGAYTQAQIQALVEMVKNCGMEGKVTWISFAPSYLGYVKAADPSARLGYLVSSVTSAVITTAQGLQTDTNEVFIDSSDYDADAVSICQAAGLPLEIYIINSSSVIQNMNAYITGVTSDNLIAGKILHDAGMVYEYGIGGETEPDEPVVPDEPEKTLTSISATYSGGDVVVGTAVNALTGIVVTAHYSDGSTEPVTGYVLSGTIAEGNNTITVSYGGMTTAITVIGVADTDTDYGDSIQLVQGQIGDTYKGETSGYISPSYDTVPQQKNHNIRVSYAGFDVVLASGKTYRLVGLDSNNGITIQYGIQYLTPAGLTVANSHGTLTDNTHKVDMGWKSNGYEFTATDNMACIWITAHYTTNVNITPEEAMPVYLEELA